MSKLTTSQDISQFLASANKVEARGILDTIETEDLVGLTLIVQADDTVNGYVGDIGSSAFAYDSTLKGLSIGSSVTSIGSQAFRYCSGFTGSLTIPNSVTSIGSDAFYGCTGFTGSLNIGNSVTTIGTYAFGFSGFTGSLVIPDSVTTIQLYAFQGSYNLNGSLIIGNSVTTIGSFAFSNCNSITRIEINRSTAPTIGSQAFYDMPAVIPAEIHVPFGATGYAASYDGLTVVYDL